MKWLWLILSLLLLTSCDSLTDFQPEKEDLTPENVTPAVEVNVTNSTNTTEEIVPIQSPLFTPRKNNLTIYFLNTKGDSTLIQHNDYSVLVDAGYEEDSEKVIKEIRNLGIETLKAIFATNTASKNIGGMPYIILRTHPEKIIDNGIPSSSSSYKDYQNSTIIEKDTLFMFGDFFVKAIVPYDDGYGFKTDMKQNSLVTKIQYGNKKFLLMSDCEVACEERIIDADLKANVLKVANGGSCDSTSLTFLQKVNPDFAIISTQTEPCKDILDRFKYLNIPVFITKDDGDIYFTTDGLDLSFGKGG
jgi:competence protein ComEC